MFRIGDFARMNQISVATQRHYDECGLLRPLRIDAESGYRYYGAEQMVTLNRIFAMKAAGFSLQEIARLGMKAYTRAQLLALLMDKEEEALAAIHRWFAQQGLAHGMPTREIYHTGEWMTDDPNE